jgi:bile acid:Na+ symporter, BASS family
VIRAISEILVRRAIWWVLTSLLVGIVFAEISLNYLMPLIPVFLAGMMGSAGLMISLRQMFKSGIKPSRISIVLSSQFILSTAVGFVVAILFFSVLSDLPNLALGQVLHGAMPGEQTTPVWIRLAGGNTALGIVTLILSTIVSPFASPVLVFSFAGTWVELEYFLMFETMALTILLPIIVGSLVRSARPKALARHDHILSATSVLFALPTVVIVGALAASFLSMQPLQILSLAIAASSVHFALTLAAGWLIPRLLHWRAPDAPVSIYNLSMKEFTVTLGVIAATGMNPEVGVPAALYGIMHMAAAPIIAKRLYAKLAMDKPSSGT